MFGYTWTQTIPYISLVFSALALLISFWKFFFDMVDRRRRIKKEKEEQIEALKAKVLVEVQKPYLIISNNSDNPANIGKILIDDLGWDQSGLFIVDEPSSIGKRQTRQFKMAASANTPYPTSVTIKYADEYSRKHMQGMHEEEFEV
ncbi:hypothetical protein [Bacillus sp. SG-1]|uniref:hypothetical protein n=1 Tax=Bacillus sp. SG-1 TaxID=161544 RepID=UPI0001543D43|nr:hypothetical protein [Bacillus sp. SG-1]EDL64992.1 hypothetical protein BSG1_14764 [Bacillus sp. SG-1]